ncbi:hypothetical protein CDAR_309181 [Caerostris darwini]|uniref:Uncharacterized protein n=1 Tax=Caerostris darwini TaxID=1538125 RepID=A0AAV4P7U2_9ARAC|nr:hypothetical protein CDAR_309181 [Caerostris darwini]
MQKETRIRLFLHLKLAKRMYWLLQTVGNSSRRPTSPPVTYKYFTHVPSDFSHPLKMARSWLLSQRQHDFGWGKETPRALTALYLSDNRPHKHAMKVIC